MPIRTVILLAEKLEYVYKGESTLPRCDGMADLEDAAKWLKREWAKCLPRKETQLPGLPETSCLRAKRHN
jgi:hypothetical protein